jgi:hypothetical protein
MKYADTRPYADPEKAARARTVRDLAEKAADPFIKGRLLDLASRFEDEGPRTTPTTLTPMDLQAAVPGQNDKVRGGQGLAPQIRGSDPTAGPSNAGRRAQRAERGSAAMKISLAFVQQDALKSPH